MTENRIVYLTHAPVELYKVLKFENLASSGGEAKHMIADGLVRVNGRVETRKRKKIFSGEFRLVAQLSQNMNFVMDLTVEAFLQMHAESRLIENIPGKIKQIYQSAVMLAGEPFSLDTAITSLSGGQSLV